MMRRTSKIGVLALSLALLTAAVLAAWHWRGDAAGRAVVGSGADPGNEAPDLRPPDRRGAPIHARPSPAPAPDRDQGVGVRIAAQRDAPVVGALVEVLDDTGTAVLAVRSGAAGVAPLPDALDENFVAVRVTHPEFADTERKLFLVRGRLPTIELAVGCLIRLRIAGGPGASSGRLVYALERPGALLGAERGVDVADGRATLGRLSGGAFRALKFDEVDVSEFNPYAVVLPTTGEYEVVVSGGPVDERSRPRVEFRGVADPSASLRVVEPQTLRTIVESKSGGVDGVILRVASSASSDVLILARGADRSAFARIRIDPVGTPVLAVPWGPTASVSAEVPADAEVVETDLFVGDEAALARADRFGDARRDPGTLFAPSAARMPARSLRWLSQPLVVGRRVSWADVPAGCDLRVVVSTTRGRYVGSARDVSDGTTVDLTPEPRVRLVPVLPEGNVESGWIRVVDDGGLVVATGSLPARGVDVVGLELARSFTAMARWPSLTGDVRFLGVEREVRLATVARPRRIVRATLTFASGAPAAGALVRFEEEGDAPGPVVAADARGRAEGSVGEGVGVTVRCVSPAVRDAFVVSDRGDAVELTLSPLTRVVVRWSGPSIVAKVSIVAPDGRRKAETALFATGGELALGAWEAGAGYRVRVEDRAGSLLAERSVSIDASTALDATREIEIEVP